MSVPSGQNLVAWRQEWILKSNSNWHKICADMALFVDIFCFDSNLYHRLDHEHVDELCRMFILSFCRIQLSDRAVSGRNIPQVS